MKSMLILGATSAIAQETAKLFAVDRLKFFLVARHAERLEILARDLTLRGAAKVGYRALDLNAFDQHSSLLAEATQSLSGLDIVLIAHGTLGDQEVCEQCYASAEQELKTNFLSVVSFLTPLANQFEKQKYGCIAVISSVAGDRGRRSNYVYGTAKGALTLFLQGLRNRLDPLGVSVITIKPGFVDTPMTAAFKKNFLFSRPDTVAQGIYNAIRRKKNVVYLPFFWWGIMAIIKVIPESIFKKLKL